MRTTLSCLAAHVLAAHVDGALQAEQCAGRGGGHTVLSGSGLGDDAGLAHAPGEQHLAEHVVDLVGTGVAEVLTLEQYGRPAALAQTSGVIQGSGAAGVVGEEARELGLKGRVRARLLIGAGELVQRRDQRLGHVAAAVGAEPGLHGHGEVPPVWSAPATAPTNARSMLGSLTPGERSTPLPTSTA